MAGLWYFRPYHMERQAFCLDWLRDLRGSILASPYLAASTLNARFSGTKGFSVTFRREGLDQVKNHFPEFVPYLEQVIGPDSNAFFLNPLVIYQGSRVAPHIDYSLKSWTAPDLPPHPTKVSVLYVDVPEDLVGGDFVLHRRRPLVSVKPERNLLLEFQGNLRHEVSEVQRAGPDPEQPQPRISLVCEHYRVEPHLRERIPHFFVRSKRTFGEFLQQELERADGLTNL